MTEKAVTFTVPEKAVTKIDAVDYAVLSDKSGYTVTVRFTAAGSGVTVLMPSWTNANGQDDLIWHNASISGNTATFTVKKSQHLNETGVYTTHIYLKDSTATKIAGITVYLPPAVEIKNLPAIPEAYKRVFDPVYYYENYPDLQQALGTNGAALWNHFLNNGMNEGRQGCAGFDPKAYRSRYEDLRNAFGDNWKLYYEHYMYSGYYEGRNPR